MSAVDQLPALDDAQAVREVAWVARRARELVATGAPAEALAAEYVEYFARKIRLLRHIGTADALSLIDSNVALLEHYERQAAEVAR